MAGAEIGIVGGPFDGTTIAVPGWDGEDSPPGTYRIPRPADVWTEGEPRDDVYRLRVNPAGEGPLWHYVHPSVNLDGEAR